MPVCWCRRKFRRTESQRPLTARSVSLPAGNELEIVHGHLLEERLVLALREGPQDRRGLLAGVPILAAADPDCSGKGGAEASEESVGRGGGGCHCGGAGSGLANEPHDAGNLLGEDSRH